MNQPKYKFPLGELISWAEQCATEYYSSGTSQISDDEFDSLKVSILQLCRAQKIDPGTIRILRGIGYVGDENKIKHPVQMYSLDNVFDSSSLSKWFEKIYSNLRTTYADLSLLDVPLSYGIEYKIDGMSLDLVYRFGRLTAAITRGDGARGENILANILHVNAIPNELQDRGKVVAVPLLVVHGELYVKKSDLKRCLAESPYFGLHKSPQSERAAVLSIRNKDFPTMGLQMSFNPHEVASVSIDANEVSVSPIPDELYSESMFERLEVLRQFGFSRASPLSPPIQHSSIRDLIVHVDSIIPKVDTMRHQDVFDHPIDGLVISVDALEYRQQIGYTARVPKWAIAYKFPALGKQTKVKQVAWQVTMDGNLIPVLKLEPVTISGKSIDAVTLFNFAKFRSHDLHHGDTVTVVMRGDVVPNISEVHADQRMDGAIGIPNPKQCPSCGSKLSVRTLHLSCLNVEGCTDQLAMRLMRFVGKAGMNIRGFGEYGMRKLIELKRVRTPADLYKLNLKQSSTLSGMSWKKILMAIEQSKAQGFLIVLNALCPPRPKGGYKVIVSQYRDMEAWIDDYLEKSESVDDDVLVAWVRSNYPMLKELYHLGVGKVNYDYDGGA